MEMTDLFGNMRVKPKKPSVGKEETAFIHVSADGTCCSVEMGGSAIELTASMMVVVKRFLEECDRHGVIGEGVARIFIQDMTDVFKKRLDALGGE